MKHTIQPVILFLLVLLQCVAPFAHAHINDGHVDHSTDNHVLHTQYSEAIQHPGHKGHAAYQHDFLTVDVPQGFQRDDALDVTDIPNLPVYRLLLPPPHTVNFNVISLSTPALPSLYYQPPAHAPPY